jgi:hypothetical protein
MKSSAKPLLVLCALFSGLTAAPACTLWGVAGERADGGGTIIVKNRDWRPDHTQETKTVTPRAGNRYFGLYAVGGDEPGIKAGVNCKGLAVVTASASCLPLSVRKQQPGKKGVLAEILASHASVDALLEHRDLFEHARAGFFLIADRQKIALVEVALGGKFVVRTETNGVVTHTNGYQEEALRSSSLTDGASSTTRLARIRTLLSEARQPLDVALFKRLSADQHAGPDNSLWRTGEKSRTLATWLLALPRQAPPALYLKLANPGRPITETNLVFDAKFWGL